MFDQMTKMTVPLAVSVLITVVCTAWIEPQTVGGIILLFLIVTSTVVILAAVLRPLGVHLMARRSAEAAPQPGPAAAPMPKADPAPLPKEAPEPDAEPGDEVPQARASNDNQPPKA